MPMTLCKRIDKFFGKPNFLEKRKLTNAHQDLNNLYATYFRACIDDWNKEYSQRFGEGNRKGNRHYYHFIYRKAKNMCALIKSNTCYADVYFWWDGDFGGPDLEIHLRKDPRKYMRSYFKDVD